MSIRLRKNIVSIQKKPEELKRLRDAFRISKGTKIIDNRSFHHISGYHGVPGWYCWHHLSVIRATIKGPVFLPWHRAYLHHLEMKIQELSKDPGFSLPYWDWRYPKLNDEISDEYDKMSEIPTAYQNEDDETGQENPLRGFKIVLPDREIMTTRMRRPEFTRPTVNDVANVLNSRNFEEFEYDLEQIHDSIHIFVGGTMANVGLASYDPIFYAHHCMIDRIWYQWQNDTGSLEKGYEQLLDVPLVPFHCNVRDVIDTKKLGYEYAGDEKSITVDMTIG